MDRFFNLRTLSWAVLYMITLNHVLPKIHNCSDEALKIKFFQGLCSFPNGTDKQSKLTQYPKWTDEAQKRQDLYQPGLDIKNDKAKFPSAAYNQTWTDIQRAWLNQTKAKRVLKQPDLRSGELYKATSALLLLGAGKKDIPVPFKEDTSDANSFTTVTPKEQGRSSLSSVLYQGDTRHTPVGPNNRYDPPGYNLQGTMGAITHTAVAQKDLDEAKLDLKERSE